MGYDGKALALAREAIAERKRANQQEQSRRRTEALLRLPALREMEGELTRLMSSVALSALKRGEDAGQAVKSARDRAGELLERKRELLISGGFPGDYLDEIFSCPRCRDTGYIEGRPCSCLREEYRAESARLLSSTLDLGCRSFESFDLSLYEPAQGCESAVRVREAMATVRDLCRQYADEFGPGSANLLFRGGTGLGKTFLSACIARVVSEKGFSVVYDTAISVFDAFEAQKFDKGEDGGAEAASKVRRCLNCDLLILDDLGTEMSAGYTQSALYTLINTRLTNGGRTIISTNLSDDDLSRRYSPQTVSRLLGEYMTLPFVGRDIREVKKERGLA